MKRMFLIVTTVLCFISTALGEPWRVFDNAKLFTDEEIKTIEQAISDFQRFTNNDFAVLTFEGYFGKNNSGDIAMAFYNSNNFGFGNQASGVIYFFHVIDGMLYASYGWRGEMCNIWNDEINAAVSEDCRNLVHEGKYSNAVLKLIESAAEAVETYKKDAI